jgi:phenylacetate-coenzyme A ligase PaaK-like adenylate-forming protein
MMLQQLWILFSKMREYARNEKLSIAEFDAMKLRKFRRLVRHAAARSSYYAELVRDRGIDIDRCSPADFPLLTKTQLLANFDRIATDPRITKSAIAAFLTRSTDPGELFLDEFQVIHTSGSSGEVGYFVFSSRDWLQGMMQRIRTKPKRTSAKKLKVMFYGAAGGHYAGVSMASLGKRGVNRWMVEVDYCEINTPLPIVIDKLNAYQPDLIAGYATALKMLAHKQQEGVLKIAPRRIEAGGETISEADRDYLKSAFGCDVFNIYACSEHLMMGVSRPGNAHMTLYDDDLIYECGADHLVVTNLCNFTLPLIRYRMSDILRPLPRQEGSPYLMVDNLVGRTEMTPTFVNRNGTEDFISPHTINEIFVSGVARFQMRLLSKTRFSFFVCLEPAMSKERRSETLAELGRRLKEILAQKLMDNVAFEIAVVDDLPINPVTRKFQLIVDERAAQKSEAVEA